MQRFVLSVGEPWDFESPDGPNRVLVLMWGFIDGPSRPPHEDAHKKYLLLETETPFSIRGETVKFMVAAARYAGDSLESIASKGGTVGVSRLRPGVEPRENRVLTASEIDYCIIGNLRPET